MLKFKATILDQFEVKCFIAQVAPYKFLLFVDDVIVGNRMTDVKPIDFDLTAFITTYDIEEKGKMIVDFCSKFHVYFTEKQLTKLKAKLEKINA